MSRCRCGGQRRASFIDAVALEFVEIFSGAGSNPGGLWRQFAFSQIDVALVMTLRMLRCSRHSRPMSRMTGFSSGEKM